MTTKLTEVKRELNTALLKVIEKDGAIGRLSEQLQVSVVLWFCPSSFCEPAITCRFVRLPETQTELEQSHITRE
jgi:hypothetical protein